LSLILYILFCIICNRRMSENKTCTRCSSPETETNPGLICRNCSCLIHFSCLTNYELPGGLLGDIYFKLICVECTGTRKELITRDKMPWYVSYMCHLSSLCMYAYCVMYVHDMTDNIHKILLFSNLYSYIQQQQKYTYVCMYLYRCTVWYILYYVVCIHI
jgi:hypothetical protein